MAVARESLPETHLGSFAAPVLDEDTWTLRALCHIASQWWRDTTDVVVLNSPWLRRGTGRAFRVLWILFHIGTWCYLELMVNVRACLLMYPDNAIMVLLSLLFLAPLMWSSLMHQRDRFGVGLCLCLGACFNTSALNDCLSYWNFPSPWNMNAQQDAFTLTFAVACHCNLHPMELLAFVLFCTFCDHQDWSVYIYGYWFTLNCLACQYFLWCAFTMDFTSRVRAVVSGMIASSDEPLESPVAGRSGRGFCWCLAGVNLFFVNATAAAVGTACLAVMSWLGRSRRISPWLSDVGLAAFCLVAPTLQLPYRYSAAGAPGHPAFSLYQMLTQALIQAGCHPWICLGFSVLWIAAAMYTGHSTPPMLVIGAPWRLYLPFRKREKKTNADIFPLLFLLLLLYIMLYELI